MLFYFITSDDNFRGRSTTIKRHCLRKCSRSKKWGQPISFRLIPEVILGEILQNTIWFCFLAFCYEVTGGDTIVAIRSGISLVLEGYVVMTIELNTRKAWDYKMYGHYLLQIPFHINYVLFL